MIKSFLIALSFVLFYNLLIFNTGLGLGISFFLLALNICFVLFRDNHSKNLSLGITSSLLSILFGALVSFRANEVVEVIDILTSLSLATLALYFYKEKNKFDFLFHHFITIPFVLAGNAAMSLFGINEKDSLVEEKPNNQVARSLFKGALIAIPIFVILLLILTSADPVFEKLTGSFLKNIQERIIVSLLLFVPLFTAGLVHFKEPVEHPIEPIKQLISKGYELAVILGSIAVLFAVFISVQFQYLFSSLGERQLAELGIKSLTFSEYVNKGFFELLVVSVISISVLSYAIHFIDRLKGREKLTIRLLSSTVLVETFLIILSAAQRINLYQADHGLTRARIFGFLFLIYLTSLLIIFLIKVFKSMSAKVFFLTIISVSLLFMLSLSMINVDGLVAMKYRPTVNGEVDYAYISTLSADAYQSWPDIIDNIDSAITTIESKQQNVTNDDKRRYFYAERELWQLNTIDVSLSKDFPWQEMNLYKYQARQFILSNPQFSQKLNDMDNRTKKFPTNHLIVELY